MRRLASLTILAACGLAAVPPLVAPAQGATARDDDPVVRKAKVANLKALSKPVTINVTDQPAQDLFKFIADVTGAEIEPVYLDDTRTEGIDPETPVTIKATDTPALLLLERVLARVQQAEGPTSSYTWQFTETGSIECGPKSELNRQQTVETYDISELLFIVPRFDNAPEFDLSSALQSSGGGGGGGSSPIQNANNDDTDQLSEADRAKRITDLIQATIEPDQWVDLGGDGASVTIFGTQLVITAPDYIHRQINGYDFWPSRLQQVRRVNGRQEVRIRPEPARRTSP